MATRSKKKHVKKNTRIVYPKSFDSNKYPPFMRKNIFLKAFPKPEKVFPRIGLENCEVPLSSIKIKGRSLLLHQLEKTREALKESIILINRVPDDVDDNLLICEDIENISSEIDMYIGDGDESSLIKRIDGKDELIVPLGFEGNTIKTNSKTNSKTKLTTVITHFIREAKKTKIDLKPLKKLSFTKEEIKAPSLTDKKNLSVCFSSEGDKGYWDIATMSMRKISSCMKWDSDHATSLVGSIVDPYAGIIYITDGTYTKYGKSMLERAVVRFVVTGHGKNIKPALFIEEIYSAYRSGIYDSAIKIFRGFLESRVKLPVICYNDETCDNVDCRIPISEPTEAIIDLQGGDDCNYLSYRDSAIDYNTIDKFYDPKKIRGLDKFKNT